MDDVYDFYDSQLNKIVKLQPHLYRVVRYTIGHQQLIVLVESRASEPNEHKHLFVVFEGVEYMQIFSSWQDAPFKLVPSIERDSLLENTGINITGQSNSPLVFCAFPTDRRILVVCWRMWVSERMPKLYEYTF